MSLVSQVLEWNTKVQVPDLKQQPGADPGLIIVRGKTNREEARAYGFDELPPKSSVNSQSGHLQGEGAQQWQNQIELTWEPIFVWTISKY